MQICLFQPNSFHLADVLNVYGTITSLRIKCAFKYKNRANLISPQLTKEEIFMKANL